MSPRNTQLRDNDPLLGTAGRGLLLVAVLIVVLVVLRRFVGSGHREGFGTDPSTDRSLGTTRSPGNVKRPARTPGEPARGRASRPTGSGASEVPRTRPRAGSLRGRAIRALRLATLAACFTLAAYAALRLFDSRPAETAMWFAGSVLAHDLLLFPLYAVTDTALVTLLRRRPELARVNGVPWINHLRFPAVISGVLLLVWTPSIFRLSPVREAVTGIEPAPFLRHWALITAVLFTLSALAWLWRVSSNALGRPQGP